MPDAASSKPAVVLLSGGLDSATCLAIARAEGYAPLYTMSFDYGQRHRHELAAAEKLAHLMGACQHRVIHIDLRQFGNSALTADIDVPKDRPAPSRDADIPITYVPARNTIFLSYALAWAEVLNARDIFIGVNAVDYSGYPDCRPQFIKAFEQMANLATKMTTEAAGAITIHAPLIYLSKAEIIKHGVQLGVDYGITHSCYDPTSQGLACGRCDSCMIRRQGFQQATVPDPTRYATIHAGTN